jgi:hypothetical protein
MNPLLTTGAALLVATGATAQSADPLEYVTQPLVRVEYGRAVLVQRGSRGELLLPETEHNVSGIAYLLVGAGARASISWRGQSSLLLHGPTEIEWAPVDEDRGTSDPVWSVLRLGAIDVEVRRGAPELKLPGGWHTRLSEGAYYVSGNGRDACDFEIRAGEPLNMRPELRNGRVRPPVQVEMGMRARLSSRLIAVSRPDATADANSWDRVSWPWRTENAPPVAHIDEPEAKRTYPEPIHSVGVEPEAPSMTLEVQTPDPELSWNSDSAPRTLDTEPPADSPLDFRSIEEIVTVDTEPVVEAPIEIVEPIAVAPEPVIETPIVRIEPDPVVVAPIVVPEPEPGAVAPIVVPEPEPVAVAPIVVPEPEPTPEPVVVDPTPAPQSNGTASFLTSQWRGLAFEDLEPVGDSAVERSPAMRATRLGTTRWRVSLSARSVESIWFFGKDLDVQLQPGASVTVGEDGFVQSRQGLTMSETAPLGRPRLSDIQ